MTRVLLVCLLVMNLGCKRTAEEESSAVLQQHSPETKASVSRGAGIYNNFCASCHLSTGEGIKGVFPPLAESDWLTKKREASLHAIKFGLKGPLKVNGVAYDNFMPALGLSDREIADVMNYINSSWGNSLEKPVTEAEVAAIEK